LPLGVHLRTGFDVTERGRPHVDKVGLAGGCGVGVGVYVCVMVCVWFGRVIALVIIVISLGGRGGRVVQDGGLASGGGDEDAGEVAGGTQRGEGGT